MRTIAHIINPVIVKETSDLYAAQPVTFETMRAAREFAKGSVEVELFTAQFPEDRPIVPDGFRPTPDLERSVLDLGSFQVKKKLPLLRDILERLYEATEAEYLIYTNVDIALMPHFYLAVDKFIEEGCDGFVINRRTISDGHRGVEDLPRMYMEMGKPHPGHDCFVFRRSACKKFVLGDVCIGANLVGRALLMNVVCHASKFREFGEEHLTFHIGDDKAWRSDALSDYAAHNKKEALKVAAALEKQFGPLDADPFLAPLMDDMRGTGGLIKRIRKAIKP